MIYSKPAEPFVTFVYFVVNNPNPQRAQCLRGEISETFVYFVTFVVRYPNSSCASWCNRISPKRRRQRFERLERVQQISCRQVLSLVSGHGAGSGDSGRRLLRDQRQLETHENQQIGQLEDLQRKECRADAKHHERPFDAAG